METKLVEVRLATIILIMMMMKWMSHLQVNYSIEKLVSETIRNHQHLQLHQSLCSKTVTFTKAALYNSHLFCCRRRITLSLI